MTSLRRQPSDKKKRIFRSLPIHLTGKNADVRRGQAATAITIVVTYGIRAMILTRRAAMTPTATTMTIMMTDTAGNPKEDRTRQDALSFTPS